MVEDHAESMDTFIDSAWYFLRFLDVTNESRPFDRQVAHQQMPVDIYIGECLIELN